MRLDFYMPLAFHIILERPDVLDDIIFRESDSQYSFP
jgi:hypothetical protein